MLLFVEALLTFFLVLEALKTSLKTFLCKIEYRVLDLVGQLAEVSRGSKNTTTIKRLIYKMLVRLADLQDVYCM